MLHVRKIPSQPAELSSWLENDLMENKYCLFAVSTQGHHFRGCCRLSAAADPPRQPFRDRSKQHSARPPSHRSSDRRSAAPLQFLWGTFTGGGEREWGGGFSSSLERPPNGLGGWSRIEEDTEGLLASLFLRGRL